MCHKFWGIIITTLVLTSGHLIADDLASDWTADLHSQNSAPLTPGNVLWWFDVETPTSDNQCLGVEYFDGYFMVTGAGGQAHPDVNMLHFFYENGTYIKSIIQPTPEYWGWRDLCFDGTYFYGSDSKDITKFIITGMPSNPVCKKVGTIPGPADPCRALAWDPATDHFWTASYTSPIYEITRTGSIVRTISNSKLVYGMAWDDKCGDSPVLWIFSQDGSPQVTISEFDPLAGVYTGLTYSYTVGFAGGATFIRQNGKGVFVGVSQTSPDQIFGMELCDLPVADVTILTETQTPVVQKPGQLKVKLTLTNNTESKVTIDVFTRVKLPNGKWYPETGWLFGPYSVTIAAGQSGSGSLTHKVPGNAPLGNYIYEANVGAYPDIEDTSTDGFSVQ